MNLNTLGPKNPLVPAPIGMGTSQISMPESFSGVANAPRLEASRLFIALPKGSKPNPAE